MKVVPPPKRPREAGTPKAWRDVESKLGLELPKGFKDITSNYGTGQWLGFWFLLNPFTKNRHLNLYRQSQKGKRGVTTTLDAERCTRDIDGLDYPHPIYPEPGGILHWARTNNGGNFFWLTRGSPSRWKTIYYADRSFDFEVYSMSCSRLLLRAVTGEIPIFAKELSEDHEYGQPDAFVPYRLSSTGGEPIR